MTTYYTGITATIKPGGNVKENLIEISRLIPIEGYPAPTSTPQMILGVPVSLNLEHGTLPKGLPSGLRQTNILHTGAHVLLDIPLSGEKSDVDDAAYALTSLLEDTFRDSLVSVRARSGYAQAPVESITHTELFA